MNAAEFQHAVQQAIRRADAGDPTTAEAMLRDLLKRDPNSRAALAALGDLLLRLKRLPEAQSCFEKICAASPNFALGFNSLGLALGMQSQFDASIRALRHAINLDPNLSPAYVNLANALRAARQLDEAERVCKQGLSRWPNDPKLLKNFAATLIAQRNYADALHPLARLCAHSDASSDMFYNLGIALGGTGQREESMAAFRRAVDLQPDNVPAALELAARLRELGKFTEAIELVDRTIAVNPNAPQPLNVLGYLLLASGQVDGAIGAFQRAIEIQPSFAPAGSNLLLALNYVTDRKPQTIFEEHRAFANRLAKRDHRPTNWRNRLDPDRALKIGYVSPDFRTHAVSYFIEPILASHDHNQFQTFCYSDVLAADETTSRLKRHAAHWRDTNGMTDDALADMIARDEIDLLVDLAGHTGGNRLAVFARRAAPVQVTYIGYPNTSGLETMDYWITDSWNDPPGQTERFATEKLVRLPRVFACYRPPDEAPAAAPTPAIKRNHVTFGCFNMPGKLNEAVIALWGKLLNKLPTSKLMLLAGPLRDATVRRDFTERFARVGVRASRLELRPGVVFPEYLLAHRDIDIMLDPFPFTGHTVSLHGLWMGVPLVTLAGNSHVSRRGVGILSNLGLSELIAQNPDDYINIATSLANDIRRLTDLRSGLRERMRQSPLCDAPGVTRELEVAYRSMWRERCNALA